MLLDQSRRGWLSESPRAGKISQREEEGEDYLAFLMSLNTAGMEAQDPILVVLASSRDRIFAASYFSDENKRSFWCLQRVVISPMEEHNLTLSCQAYKCFSEHL